MIGHALAAGRALLVCLSCVPLLAVAPGILQAHAAKARADVRPAAALAALPQTVSPAQSDLRRPTQPISLYLSR